MSINGVFRTSVSGMNAQANKLSVVSDNIANSSTNGYKRADVEFSSLVIDNGSGKNKYTSGAVLSNVRHDVSTQGLVSTTNSQTDLAISGDGFFRVEDQNGQPFYTRSGSFVQRTEAGTGDTFLVNASGYRLIGENGPIQVPVGAIAEPRSTDTATISLQLPSNGPDNQKGSLITYNTRGEEVVLSMNAQRTVLDAGGTDEAGQEFQAGDEQWTLTFTTEDGAENTKTVYINPVTGTPRGGNVGPIQLENPNFDTPIQINFGQVTSYDADYSFQSESNGNPTSGYSDFAIDNDGRFYGVLTTGSRLELDRVQLARFRSPDQLNVKTGNIFTPSGTSGDPQLGFSGDIGFGDLVSGALEESNVDLASELTDMIVAQRSYSANSKTFQTGSEMLDLLVNLKR